MKTIRMRQAQLFAFAKRAGSFFLKSHILTVWVVLCAIGFFIGTQARPDPSQVPYDEIFENLRVLSYREAPSDTTTHFLVELSARNRPFRHYDVDAQRFIAPAQGHEYWRTVSGTSYEPLKIRGHVGRGVWLEIPDSSMPSLVPEQFDELYSSTMDLVNPVTMATSVIGILSGYSVGYRLATWGSSLASPAVQERVLATPGIGRAVAREAWRRVALEPAIVFADKDPGRFASVSGRQRLYTKFFKTALNDSNGFIPYEAARLEAAGAVRASRAMVDFATAARRAARDTCDLSSADFAAIEEWASLLDRQGHWAVGSFPPRGEERIRYLGVLSWYGLAPEAGDQHRLWIGPRLLVRNGNAEGFITDEIPRIHAACPVSWQAWMGGQRPTGANSWTAQWMGEARQYAPVLELGQRVARAMSGVRSAATVAKARSVPGAAANAAATVPSPVASHGAPAGGAVVQTNTATPSRSMPTDTTRVARTGRADSVSITLEQLDPDAGVIRSSFGSLGK